MKKVIFVLFFAQLILICVYGLIFLRYNTSINIFDSYDYSVSVSFDETWDFSEFINRVADSDIEITRTIFLNNDTATIYTTDITLNNRISLSSGNWPMEYSQDFIANFTVNESEQTGYFRNIIPHYNVAIRHMYSIQYVGVNGRYNIYTSTPISYEEIREVFGQGSTVYFDNAFSFEPSPIVTILYMLIGGFNLAINTEVYIFILVNFIIFLSTLISLISYGISNLKAAAILKIHGFSNIEIIKKQVSSIFKYLISAIIIVYTLLCIYVILGGYSYFLPSISILYVLGAFVALCGYILFVSAFIATYLEIIPATSILKGKIPYKIVQVFNVLSKSVLIATTAMALTVTFNNLDILNQASEALSNWEKSENIHRIRVADIGQVESLEIEDKLFEDLGHVYYDLVNNHNAFIMNAHNMNMIDLFDRGGNFYESTAIIEGSVTVSPNYFNFNPILSVSGNDVREYIVWDNHVLNILVPISISQYTNNIIAAFEEFFYFQAVDIANSYDTWLNREPSILISPEDLSVNVIYTDVGQDYFVFDHNIRLQDMNMLRDVIVIIYTENIHRSNLYSEFTRSLYFYTDAIDAFSYIHPVFYNNNLGSLLGSVESVYDSNLELISTLRQTIFRNISIFLIMIFIYIIFTYSFVANYVNKNIYKLFIKRTFGFSSLSSNRIMLFTMIISTMFLLLALYIFFGYNVLFLGIVLVFCDLSVLVITETLLIKKHNTEIMKGKIQ